MMANIASQISDTISLKSQQTSQEMLNSILNLNKSATEDSTSVSVITLVMLLYLPSSFIGVRSSLISGSAFD
jgi:hypothetical protein